MPQALVLSVGSDSSVLDTRGLILRSAGYIVVSAMSIQDAVHLFQDRAFDLIILCHTLPIKDCERLTCFIRASDSRIPIVCVSGAVAGEHIALADATLDKDPVEFLRALEDVFNKHARMQPIEVPDPPINDEAASAKKPRRSVPALIGMKKGRRLAMGH
jgi:CheY-like chemotaxis protein